MIQRYWEWKVLSVKISNFFKKNWTIPNKSNLLSELQSISSVLQHSMINATTLIMLWWWSGLSLVRLLVASHNINVITKKEIKMQLWFIQPKRRAFCYNLTSRREWIPLEIMDWSLAIKTTDLYSEEQELISSFQTNATLN